ncbi:MAG TPA: hypothetical protein DHW14_07145 [Clostridiales bacterium]|nr:hypothetical protein [Clostridiales bacterium]
MKSRGFGLVTGEVGSGKSTALRALAAALDTSTHPVFYVSQSGLTRRHLYPELALGLGLDPAYQTADTRRQVTRALWDAHSSHRKEPLIVTSRGAPPLPGHARGGQVPHQLLHGLGLPDGPVPGRPDRTLPQTAPEEPGGHQPQGEPPVPPRGPS